ncbi:hypothetical protein V8E51_002889 [Hyaloscypha variabilis]
MCRIHTETMYAQCGHTFFTQRTVQHPSCVNTDLYSMATNNNQICPRCQSEPPAARITDDVGNIEDWRRRMVECQEALAATPTGPTFNAVPVNHWPNFFLTDRCDLLRPEVQVVPPGMIRPENDRCGVCCGSLTSLDKDEECKGYGARRLPCGHIFGRRCLLSTFQIGQEAPGRRRARCVACFREFLITLNRQSSPLPFWVASIENLVTTVFRRYGTRWTPAVAAIFPYLIASTLARGTGFDGPLGG